MKGVQPTYQIDQAMLYYRACIKSGVCLSEAYEKLAEWGWGMAFVQLFAFVFLFPVRVFWGLLVEYNGVAA
jgi:hypothetical protein